ncbi:uncharacterized protein LOC128550495 [Mercenaria mercenaria]|uniref:uncharacterized protein LOC128550495 n=1 Tax=Mercenaria mercenaria TaxID=6596 RepID=UPI00234E393F|nr:uncharacterized protein LOC128550495 [Mercenaria mercenaria]
MATAEGEHGSDFEETMFCEPCNKEGNTVEADGFCSDCSDYLCSTCLKYHKRLAKDHTLFDKSSMPQDFCLERCVFHPNDLVKFYCTKCDNTACPQCIPIEHQTECSEFKHIPSYMQSQDVYRELKEVKKSLKAVEEEASRTGDENGQKLKKATLNSSDISKSISLQKKYIKDKIEEQRIEIFKALDDERAEVIRKLDDRQGRRKEQLFEQQKLINSKIDDEANHLDEQLMLYPRKIQNIALNSANIRSKLESLTTVLVNKERQGRKAELFVATKRTKHNMKTLQKDIDDVCKENKVRCFTFRRNTENISIDAAENATLGSLIEESEQGDRDTTNGQQGTFNSASSTDTRIFAQNNIAVEEVQRDVTSEKIKRPDVCGRAEDPEFAIQRVATAVNAAGQAYITAKAVFKTWQDKLFVLILKPVCGRFVLIPKPDCGRLVLLPKPFCGRFVLISKPVSGRFVLLPKPVCGSFVLIPKPVCGRFVFIPKPVCGRIVLIPKPVCGRFVFYLNQFVVDLCLFLNLFVVDLCLFLKLFVIDLCLFINQIVVDFSLFLNLSVVDLCFYQNQSVVDL